MLGKTDIGDTANAPSIVLDNPDDKTLLYSLSRQNEKHKQAGLSIMQIFTTTKGEAMKQEWHIGTPWQIYQVEDRPDGFFPDLAYQHLESHLKNQVKKSQMVRTC